MNHLYTIDKENEEARRPELQMRIDEYDSHINCNQHLM